VKALGSASGGATSPCSVAAGALSQGFSGDISFPLYAARIPSALASRYSLLTAGCPGEANGADTALTHVTVSRLDSVAPEFLRPNEVAFLESGNGLLVNDGRLSLTADVDGLNPGAITPESLADPKKLH
jgi:hypothetical protein